MRKHARAKPFKGGSRIGDFSTLRKRMRAARRGFVDALVPTKKAIARHIHPRSKRHA